MQQVPDNLKDARILILDDEELSTSLLARMLKRAGYRSCITINDPMIALERFDQIQPDIVLLDLHMEPINGFDVLNILNTSIPPQLRPSVLLFTGDTSLEARSKAMIAGVNDFLVKPLDPHDVSDRVLRMLKTRSPAPRQFHNS